MRSRALAVAALAATTLLAAPALAHHESFAYEGGGVVIAHSAFCRHPPGPAPVALSLHDTRLEPWPGPDVLRWRVELAGSSLFGCPVTDAATCFAYGDFHHGFWFDRCAPLRGHGSLTHLRPDPPVDGPHRVHAYAGLLAFETPLGSLEGDVRLVAALEPVPLSGAP